MNKDLQYILDFIKNAEHLSEKEKADLTKSVKNADKELTISEFKLERTEKVKKTTAILLEETIAELEQKRKDVEKHSRELEIEAALERVRARGMAMQTSEELRALIGTLFIELTKLDLALTRCVIWIIDPETNDAVWWMANSEDPSNPMSYLIPYHKKSPYLAFLKEWEKRTVKWVYDLKGQTKKSWDDHLFAKTELSKMPKFIRDGMRAPDRVLLSASFSNFGGMNVASLEPLSDEHFDILLRFAKVFDLTYTRFNDLKKAELQAREAEIELALERVRARTMAMHQSTELNEVVALMYDQIKKLGLSDYACSIIICDEANKILQYWYAEINQPQSYRVYNVPLTSQPVVQKQWELWKKGVAQFNIELKGKGKKDYTEFMLSKTDHKDLPENVKEGWRAYPDVYFSYSNLKYGLLEFVDVKPINEDNFPIYQRFAKVFEQTYTRFLDLQRAETQVRESEIQLALERVRARTMAMHNSNELGEVASVLFEQIGSLTSTPDRFNIAIANEEDKSLDVWITDQEGHKITQRFIAKTSSSPVVAELFQGWKKQEDHFILDLYGEKLEKWIRYMGGELGMPFKKDSVKDHRFVSSVYFSHGFIGVTTHKEPGSETINLLERFSKVFQQTYVRFLDLQKAEAQAHEAKIEAALERVRARSMAMHESQELREIIACVFEELQKLDFVAPACSLIFYQDDKSAEHWFAGFTEGAYPQSYTIPYIDIPYYTDLLKAWQEGSEYEEFIMEGQAKIDYAKWLLSETDFKNLPKEFVEGSGMQTPIPLYFSDAYNKYGMLEVIGNESLPEAKAGIVKRMSKVFEQAYTRFLDLQKAEAQARESEIQLALERVRARTMAMHKSDELSETAKILFEQFDLLGKIPDRMGVGIINEKNKEVDFWLTDQSGKEMTNEFSFSIEEPTSMTKMYKAWKEGKDSLVVDLKGKSLEDWLQFTTKEARLPVNIANIKGRRVHQTAFFSQGFLVLTTNEPVTDEMLQLLVRFAGVFDQTYRRFLDLQKAEEQAREAQIEAALEKVRARAMAMHSSDDLGETVDAFFSELTHLNVLPHRCGVGIMNPETRTVDINATTATHENERKKITGKLKLSGHPVLDKVFENWKLQKEYHPVLRGKEILDYYKVMNPQVEFPDFAGDEIQYGYYFYFKEGGVFGWTEKELSETDLNIFRRFTSVLSLTYRRYLDLREAEAQAREAVKQASLDRVRGEIASMRTSEDLNRITPVIWRELKALEVPFIRCGVFIVDEANESVGVFLTTPDGKALGVLHLAFDSNDLTSNTVKHWKKKQVYKEHWNKEDFINWTKSMMKLGQVQNPETYQGSSQPPESLHLHFVPFAQGMLYVGNVEPLDDEKLELARTLAEAFSIAYARYEDFKNLEEAKAAVENTLKELKSAQAQLVHSEKLASLGELTAGIAHEIKNPLNFVNNFSEVSSELIDEMIEELQKGNNEDVLDLVNDLKQNLEKINHHGKRADSIVKGMLLHSRGTAGEKAPTDINDLLEQYVNLAYHGMRAQNKDFNITIERDYDKSLDKINVVPQDISRVFLNIINNGCYAANDKKKTGGDGFSPTITVSTKNLKDKVEIRIKDNGNGVPDKIKDKLFQPFFTTKPTGEGTGLGLSLSYDIIVKQHGGQIKIESKEGEGAEFVITLPNK